MEEFEFLDNNFLDFSIYEEQEKNKEQEEDEEQEYPQCDLNEGCLSCGS